MNKANIRRLEALLVPPALDVCGQWMSLRNLRTGTRSINDGVLGHRVVYKHRDARNWKRVWWQVILPRIKEVFIFTFVRNPWDRALSAFLHCRDRTKEEKYKIGSEWEFGPFVREVLATADLGFNLHFVPQAATLIPGVFVGRFENIREDWAYIAGRLNVKRHLLHKGAVPHRHYTEYYESDTIEIIRDLYREEIEALGYEYGK